MVKNDQLTARKVDEMDEWMEFYVLLDI